MTCFSWSSDVPALFLPGLPRRVCIIYDQVDDKLDRCTIQRPSFTQQFFLGVTSGSIALFPSEIQRLRTWLAAWLASRPRGCISVPLAEAAPGHLTSPLHGLPLRAVRGPHWPQALRSPGSQTWLCGDLPSVPCCRLGKGESLPAGPT